MELLATRALKCDLARTTLKCINYCECCKRNIVPAQVDEITR